MSSFRGRGYRLGGNPRAQVVFNPNAVVKAANQAIKRISSKRRMSSTRSRGKGRLRTKTFTKTKVQRARPLPNRSGSESAYNIKIKPNQLIKKVLEQMQASTYTNNVGVVRSTASAGTQDVFTFVPVYDPADLGQCVGVATNTGTTAIENQTTRIYMKSCHEEIAIQNSSNAVCRITLYDVISRRDCFADANGHSAMPDITWQDGIQHQQVSGGASTSYNTVGVRPYDSKAFNDWWKIKRITYLDLAPGQVHYHRVNYSIHKFVSQEWLGASGLAAGKGWSLGTMMVSYGEPCGDNSGGATTEKIRLNCVQTKTYHFSWVRENSSLSYQTNGLSTVTSGNIENLVTGASSAFAAVT